MLVKLSHPQKAPSSTTVTLEGIVTLLKLVQAQNDQNPILFTVEGIDIRVTWSQ